MSPASDTPPPMTKQAGSRIAARSAVPCPSQDPTISKQRSLVPPGIDADGQGHVQACRPLAEGGAPGSSWLADVAGPSGGELDCGRDPELGCGTGRRDSAASTAAATSWAADINAPAVSPTRLAMSGL